MPRPSRLKIAVPKDLELHTAVCSYGYYLLAPNRWIPAEATLERRFNAAEWGSADEHVVARIDQPTGRGESLRVRCDRAISSDCQRGLRRAIIRMLRLDEDMTRWRRLHPAARRRGFGRLFRSATLFEDMVKTITGCNVGWPSTVRMNELLTTHVGGGAYPTPAQLARWTPSRLQKRCKVGYRAKRIIALARGFDRGAIDPAWFESSERTDEELTEALLALDGFGPYATANVLQLLGRYDCLPIDTETYRLYCKATGAERPRDPKKLDPLIAERYEPYRPYRFLAYWYELWRDYESQRGDAPTWDPDTTGRSFTASQLEH